MNDKTKPIITEEKQYKEHVPLSGTSFQKKPDDVSGIYVEASFKVTDPESGEILVEGRA